MTSLAALGRSVFGGTPSAELTFLVGGPGSGKGTLSEMLKSRVGHAHVSIGELLRAEAAKESSVGVAIASVIDEGGIVPSSVAIRLLLEHIRRALGELPHGTERADWVVDGFPRKIKSAEIWESLGFRVKGVVALEADAETMADRLMKRGRNDDRREVIESRIATHWREWPRIREFYRDRGLLTVVDATGDAEETWERFLKASPELRVRDRRV